MRVFESLHSSVSTLGVAISDGANNLHAFSVLLHYEFAVL